MSSMRLICLLQVPTYLPTTIIRILRNSVFALSSGILMMEQTIPDQI